MLSTASPNRFFGAEPPTFAFSPAPAGEKVPKADEGASPACLGSFALLRRRGC
jgi:hypothetical protein